MQGGLLGTATTPCKVQLFIALLFAAEAPVDEILRLLDRSYGNRERIHGPVAFSWTEYYREEMGSPLQKMYFSYAVPIDRDELPAIKLRTNAIERQFADATGNRMVNIDPGYVARDKVVLATTKDFYHRLHLGRGIYGEVTLHYRKGRFRYFSWTYPDYRDPEVMRFLERIRAPLVRELRRTSD
jgi:hypothetical protein